MPQDAVEQVFRALVGFGNGQAGRGIGMLAEQRVRNAFWLGVHLVDRNIIRQGRIGRKIRLAGETIAHRRGGRVHLVHGRQPQNEFDCAQDARLVVLSADDFAAFGVRTAM